MHKWFAASHADRLSGDPTSYKNFVPRIMTTEPLQFGNCISKKCAQMSFRIQHSISNDPNDEQPDRNHAQRMAVKKRVTMFGHVELLAFRLLLSCKDTRIES